MADDKAQVGGQDRQRISLSEDYEVRDWMESFRVSKEKLVEAVNAVGERVDDVREYLNR